MGSGNTARPIGRGRNKGPQSLRMLLVGGPLPSQTAPGERMDHAPVALRVPVSGGESGAELDAEKTLTWERPTKTTREPCRPAVAIDVDEASAAPANTAPFPAVAASPGYPRGLVLAVGGLLAVASILAVVAVPSLDSAPAALETVSDAESTRPAKTASKTPAKTPAPRRSLASAPSETSQAVAPSEEPVLIIDAEELADEDSDGEEQLVTPEARRLAQRRMSAADAALANGERDAAIALYAEAQAADPELTAVAAARLSTVYFDQGRFDFAIAYGEQAVKANFDDPASHIILGDAYYRSGASDDARLQYDAAAQLGSPRAAGRLSTMAKSAPPPS